MTRRRRKPRMPALRVIAGLLVAGLLAACGSSAAATTGTQHKTTGFPVTFSRCGTTYTFTSPPRILITTPYAASEAAEAGGNQTGHIVAYAQGGGAPLGPEGANLATVRQLDEDTYPSKETIVGLAPNLVVTHGLLPGVAGQLSTLGIKTMIVNVCCDSYPAQHGGHEGYQVVFSDVELLGRLLGTPRYAAASVAGMKKTIATVAREAKSLPKQSVAEIDDFSGQIYAYGPASLSDTEIHTLGMTNAFGDLHSLAPFTSVSVESLINRNPGIIILGYSGGLGQSPTQVMKTFLTLPGVSQLTAVRQHKVIVINDVYRLSRPAAAVQLLYNKIKALR